jgi:Flp pilus assembly protein TadG
MRGIMIRVALCNSLRCKSGSVAVSTALIAPLLILMIAGVVDLGRATYDATSLAGAVRAGAQYALRAPNDDAGIKQAVKAASNLSGGTVTATTQQFCECPDGYSSSCTVACGTGTLRKFVTVSATLPFSRIMTSSSIVVPSSLSAQAVVRTQ